MDNDPMADRVAALVNGVTKRDAQAIEAQYPEVNDRIISWIRESAREMDWDRVGKFANLAAQLNPPGLGAALQEILDSDARHSPGLNREDLADILGEIMAVDSADCLFRLAQESVQSDAPAYWLLQKIILALGEFNTPQSNEHLRSMTEDSWPDPVRWHAAVMLGIEDDLGFDEDQMLGY